MKLPLVKNKIIVLFILSSLIFIYQDSVTYTGGAPGGY